MPLKTAVLRKRLVTDIALEFFYSSVDIFQVIIEIAAISESFVTYFALKFFDVFMNNF